MYVNIVWLPLRHFCFCIQRSVTSVLEAPSCSTLIPWSFIERAQPMTNPQTRSEETHTHTFTRTQTSLAYMATISAYEGSGHSKTPKSSSDFLCGSGNERLPISEFGGTSSIIISMKQMSRSRRSDADPVGPWLQVCCPAESKVIKSLQLDVDTAFTWLLSKSKHLI